MYDLRFKYDGEFKQVVNYVMNLLKNEREKPCRVMEDDLNVCFNNIPKIVVHDSTEDTITFPLKRVLRYRDCETKRVDANDWVAVYCSTNFPKVYTLARIELF